jgi:hypothetical protein
MEKEFANYEQSLALKELRFDEQCYGHYDSTGELNTIEEYARVGADILHMLSKKFNSESYMKEMCSAPLKQQVFRWFRDNYPELDFGFGKIHNETNNYHFHINLEWQFFEGTYGEAENACIDKLIEIIKNK